MNKVVLSCAVLLLCGGTFISCKEKTKEKEVIIKEKSTTTEEADGEGVLERVGKEVDKEVDEEVDKTIDKIGGE